MTKDNDGRGSWDPFGHPIFSDPAARALSRVGVIDVGSNSVRLVVFDGAARSPAYFFNEKVMCALGTGVAETGHLHPEGRARALDAIKRFALIAKGIGLPGLSAVATAAVRDSSDGQDFVDEIERETGLKVYVIDGQEEARLSAQGVLLGWPGAYGLVCDIGGASLELAEIADGRVGKRVTSDLGPLKLVDVEGGEQGRKQLIDDTLTRLSKELGQQSDRLFLVGGSWRAIARIDMQRRNYPLHVLHEYRMTHDDVRKTIHYILAHDLEELRIKCGISQARMALVPIAAEVLGSLVEIIAPYDIAISSYGIREGMLYEQMPGALRDRDPLIEACRFAEAKDARLPGFGKRLYEFVLPAFPDADTNLRRMIKAACLLHDVGWRSHPDYRAETVFENTTRANLGGLTHAERVFLSLALLHRYTNKREDPRFTGLINMISEDEVQKAEILGKSMRLGAMLWTAPDEGDAEMAWDPETKQLTLQVPRETEDLIGEVAETRFRSLAGSMRAESHAINVI